MNFGKDNVVKANKSSNENGEFRRRVMAYILATGLLAGGMIAKNICNNHSSDSNHSSSFASCVNSSYDDQDIEENVFGDVGGDCSHNVSKMK